MKLLLIVFAIWFEFKTVANNLSFKSVAIIGKLDYCILLYTYTIVYLLGRLLYTYICLLFIFCSKRKCSCTLFLFMK